MTVRWLGETPSFRWLGLPPDSCFSKPGFSDCFAHSISFANAVCQAQPAEVRGDCVQYNADLYAYNNCKVLCPEITAPLESCNVAVARAVCPTRTADGLTATVTVAMGVGWGGVTAKVA